jgi:hypothetical protein
MSIYTKKHKHSAHHKRRKRRYSHKHSKHHPKKTYKKRRELTLVPGTKSIPIFTPPNKPKGQKIPVNIKQPFGNIIPGLRDYMKNM